MLKVFDLHNDYFLKIKGKKRDKYISKYVNNNSVVSAVWTSELNEYESLTQIENARDYVTGKVNLFLGVEDLHFLTNENLERFLTTKPVYAGLTWNTCNCLAGGAHEHGTLTRFGKKVITNLEKYDIKVDTAHLNEDSFMEISKIVSKPIFCSHTAFYGVNANKRNLKDYQIKMIIESGGIIGLCLVSEFLNGTKKSTVKDVIGHIDYFACKFGINNLAIGTDFYGTNYLPKSITNYSSLVTRLSSELVKLGYTEKSLNKIFYENANNFLVSSN